MSSPRACAAGGQLDDQLIAGWAEAGVSITALAGPNLHLKLNETNLNADGNALPRVSVPGIRP
jgi:hypothetical protein